MTTRDAAQTGAARRMPTLGQAIMVASLATALVAAGIVWPRSTLSASFIGIQMGFVASALWRAALVIASLRPTPSSPKPSRWPRYTILAALHDEAAVVPQLIQRLSKIDYPRRQLEGFLVLEAHDQATINAAKAARRPGWLRILVVPPGAPKTKPRALNHALAFATGELLTIYDAEDEPDPGQLREAASRFAGQPQLGCLQAPLRIRRRNANSRPSSTASSPSNTPPCSRSVFPAWRS